MEPKKPELEKTEPNLVSVAREIIETRLATSTNNTYIGWKLEELDKLDSFCQGPITTYYGVHGILGEAIFLDTLRHSDIKIEISSGDEDCCGIDFYFNDFPIDVTTNPESLEKKFDAVRYTTLYLPKYRGQDNAFIQSKKCANKKTYVLKHLREGSICTQEYIFDLFQVNLDILKNITSQIDSPHSGEHFPHAALNNEKNLNDILEIFACSSLLNLN